MYAMKVGGNLQTTIKKKEKNREAFYSFCCQSGHMGCAVCVQLIKAEVA